MSGAAFVRRFVGRRSDIRRRNGTPGAIRLREEEEHLARRLAHLEACLRATYEHACPRVWTAARGPVTVDELVRLSRYPGRIRNWSWRLDKEPQRPPPALPLEHDNGSHADDSARRQCDGRVARWICTHG